MARIIFIEGVSGTGKSTTAAGLAAALRAQGRTAAYYLEGAESPLDFCHSAYLPRAEYEALLRSHPQQAGALAAGSMVADDFAIVRYQLAQQRLYDGDLHTLLASREFCYRPQHPVPVATYQRVFMARWQRFADDVDAATDYHIFDGSLLHHQANDLLRNYDLAEDAIADHLLGLLQIVQPLRPALLYLTTRDVPGRLAAARQARGQSVATAQEVAFWQRRGQIDAYALARMPVEVHIFDVSDGGRGQAVDEMVGLLMRESIGEA